MSGIPTATIQLAQVAAVATTDACYRALLDAEIGRAFEKVDVIDQLIHDDEVASFSACAGRQPGAFTRWRRIGRILA